MKCYLGIDIGTSSVKALLADRSGVIARAKRAYGEPSLSGWEEAVRGVISDIIPNAEGNLGGVGFSSQVGTYITDEGDTVHWWEDKGAEELSLIRERFTDAELLSAISMHHPDIVSYPLPRYLYIKKHYPNAQRVMMPKEYFIERLVGEFVSDPYSQRGLYNFKEGRLAEELLRKLGIDFTLPRIAPPTGVAGVVTADGAREFSLPEGVRVYLGMNDFFSGLLGMGVWNAGDAFDVSGTSEHVGYICDGLRPPPAVSGDYLRGFVSYGGTKSSGTSCSFCIENFGTEGTEALVPSADAPIFLPYLSGERAPIYDGNARGVFFGIDAKTDRTSMAYSVLEGVVFSLYDIADTLGLPKGGRLISGGGSSENLLMARLKAELFERETVVCRERDTSALGAVMCAMVGAGEFKDYSEAMELVRYRSLAEPTGIYRPLLLRRFELYRSLYRALKPEFLKYTELKEIKK